MWVADNFLYEQSLNMLGRRDSQDTGSARSVASLCHQNIATQPGQEPGGGSQSSDARREQNNAMGPNVQHAILE